MVFWEIWILWKYWGKINMVEKSGGYHAPPFKGSHGVAQGDSLLTMIFNFVVDAKARHWVTAVVEEEVVPEGLRRSIQRL